ATVAAAREMPDPGAYDAVIVGGGVYIGSWVKDGTDYLERYTSALAGRPVWLFSSGPLPGSTKESKSDVVDPLENALGPAEGPGSGGRRKLAALSDAIRPRGHRVLLGAYDPTDPPKGMAERFVRLMPASKGMLPAGDFREWPAIEAWAREIAAEIVAEGATPVPAAPVPVG
ncbi:MAG: flavodoxin domain-containing protein, partial [Chloroflexi bacterium]|nr:flavodoxin domain-containing protein [Chloroflexota bacterium]